MYSSLPQKPKSKAIYQQQTAADFASTHQDLPHLHLHNHNLHNALKQESFSFEVQAERQYVHRLKQQREKIEALYVKYDGLLEEMRKKDEKIKDQERKIGELSAKCKDFSLLVPQLELLRKENHDLVSQNNTIRYNMHGVQASYSVALNEYKDKQSLIQRERSQFEEITEQLHMKLKQMQLKLQDNHITHQKLKRQLTQKLQSLQKQLQQQKSSHISQISLLSTQLLHRDQDIDILSKQNKKLHDTIIHFQQSLLENQQKNEQKLSILHIDYKNKIKYIKQEIQEHRYNNCILFFLFLELLVLKINGLGVEIEKIGAENLELRNTANQDKQRFQHAVYEVKVAASQEKSVLRENVMQLESKLIRLEKELADALRREKDLIFSLKRFEENQMVKKNIRDVQRREIQKINRLLLLEK